MKVHLKKFTPGKLKKETRYAAVIPKKDVRIKTPINKINELEIYFNKNVFFNKV